MPGIARMSGADSATTSHPAVGKKCAVAPTGTATSGGSGDVFVNGIGVVRNGDPVASHTFPGCGSHTPGLASFSGNVFANGLNIGRLGDTYGCGATITSGSGNVIAN